MEENEYYDSRNVSLLQNKYCPYAFLIFGFALRDTGDTHMTNGAIESLNGFVKSISIKNRVPHRYINDTQKITEGQAIQYLDTLRKTGYKKKKIPSDFTDSNECEGDNKHSCAEGYNKTRKRSFEHLTQSKPTGMGYQRNVNLDMVEEHVKSQQKSIFKSKKAKSALLDVNDINILLDSKKWLNNFVIQSYISAVIDNSTFMINSEQAHEILIKNKHEELLNNVRFSFANSK